MKMRNWLMVLTGALVLPASMSIAQSGADAAETETIPTHPALTKPFFIAAGAYYPTSATNALLAPSGGGTGVGVDFEDTLGLSERKLTGIVSARWRFAEKWRLEAEYFNLKRSATRTLATEIEWGDTTYPVGTAVDSTFDITDTRLAVGYSFFKRKDKEIGAGLGLHVTGLDASISGSGGQASASDVLAPLPVANFYALFVLTDRWALAFRYDWLSLSYEEYSGDIRNLVFELLYQPFDTIGFGIGTRTLTMDVEIDETDWRGTANLFYQGPQAFVSVTF